jgi:hypothetical protein
MISTLIDFAKEQARDHLKKILGFSAIAPHRLYHSHSFTFEAILNGLTFFACKENGLLYRTEQGEWLPTEQCHRSASRKLEFRCGLTQLSKFLKAHWKGANFDPDSIRDILRAMESLGLLEIVHEDPRLGRPKKYIGFVIANAVKAYETGWQVFMQQQEIAEGMQGKKQITIPKHGGSFMNRLMGLLFKRKFGAGFGKKTEPEPSRQKTRTERHNELKAAETATIDSMMECNASIKQQEKLRQTATTENIIEAEKAHLVALQRSLSAIQNCIRFEFLIRTGGVALESKNLDKPSQSSPSLS